MTAPSDGHFPTFSPDVPTPARMYDYCLGGKDNFATDRHAVQAVLSQLPEMLDAMRSNRQFLYRLVRFLARDAGIQQFLDMGSGMPTQDNVHDVAQRFRPDARVVYVDNDPIVLAHGRALLAVDDSTAVVAADVSRPEKFLTNPDTLKLIDFSTPVAVLCLSVGHLIADDDAARRMLAAITGAVVSGSYLAFTQMAGVDKSAADESNALAAKLGVPWKTRLPRDIGDFLQGLEPVEPGLGDITHWRPDPTQPQLPSVDEPLRPHLGASAHQQRFIEYGGLLRRP